MNNTVQWSELEVSKYPRLKSILEDKQQFGFYIIKNNRFNRVIEKYRININSSIDEMKKVEINIYEDSKKVDLHCRGEYSTHHETTVKDTNNIEDCIVSVIDKWNCDCYN